MRSTSGGRHCCHAGRNADFGRPFQVRTSQTYQSHRSRLVCFTAGGSKGAAALEPPAGEHASGRVFVVEGVIDALAARALEAGRQGTEGTIYASTAGAFGVRTAAAISALLPAGGGHLVAGVDRGEVGESNILEQK